MLIGTTTAPSRAQAKTISGNSIRLPRTESDPVSPPDAGAGKIGRDPRYVGLEIRISHASMIVDEYRFSGKASAAASSSEYVGIGAGRIAGDLPPVVVRFLPDLVHFANLFSDHCRAGYAVLFNDATSP